MSLINDALRKAKAAQTTAPPPPVQHLSFRPVEPAQRARHGLGVAVPLGLGVVGLLLLLFAWHLMHRQSLSARAETTPPAAPIATPEPAFPAPAVEPPKAAALVEAVPVASAAPLESAVAPTNVSSSDSTNVVAVTPEPPAPKSPPLKLQGITYHPTRPSAMINGKTLFVGERINEFRVAQIGRDSALLVSSSQTNLLSLP